MRCDVNISLRPVGSESFGTRVEIKNLNSFAFAEKAINYEIKRQTALLRNGEAVETETRRFNAAGGVTETMRKKESADDYRYLPEPDLPWILLSETEIQEIAHSLPELPMAQAKRLANDWGVRQRDVEILTEDPASADFFECVAKGTLYPQTALNLLLTELLPHCAWEPFSSPVSAARLAELTTLLGDGEINSATAKKLMARLLQCDFSPAEAVEKEGLAQIRDEAKIAVFVADAIEKTPRAVADWLGGKSAAIKSLQGRVMASSGGRADPILAERLLKNALEAIQKEKEGKQ